MKDLVIDVMFRECWPGEVLNNNRCIKCIRGTYSIDPFSITCNKCLDNSVCDGGSVLNINPGYWRVSSVSTTVYKCPLDSSCL